METLKKIITIITKNRVKNIEIIGNKAAKSSKINEFYHGIQSGKFNTDEDAASYFYGSPSTNNPNYKKLKKRLQKRLINTIFFIDVNQPGFGDIQRAYYSCYKDLAAIKILLGKSGRNAAIPMTEQIIKYAIQFEFCDLALEFSRILRGHYAVSEINQKKYKFYNSYVKKFSETLQAEIVAEEYRQRLSTELKSPKHNPAEIEQLAIKYTEELKGYSHLQSYRLNLFSFLVFVYRYQVINDYKNVIVECEKAIQFFKSKQYKTPRTALVLFLYKILACCIQLKEFKKGEIVTTQCLELLQEGEPNWFGTLEQHLLLSFHTNNLSQAYQIFCKATETKGYNNLYDASEDWRVHEAYIHYLLSVKAIIPPANEKIRLKNFRLSTFLNDMPKHSKDKRRKNIPILIVHVLFLLQKKNYEGVINRVESLNQYCYRYLRKDGTFRSNCFIKMLLQLPKANFHRQAVIRKTEKLHNKLLEHPSNIVTQHSEIEIMPYETLWKYVLDSLDNRIYATR